MTSSIPPMDETTEIPDRLNLRDATFRLQELASIRKQEALVADGIDRWELARDAAAIESVLHELSQRPTLGRAEMLDGFDHSKRHEVEAAARRKCPEHGTLCPGADCCCADLHTYGYPHNVDQVPRIIEKALSATPAQEEIALSDAQQHHLTAMMKIAFGDGCHWWQSQTSDAPIFKGDQRAIDTEAARRYKVTPARTPKDGV